MEWRSLQILSLLCIFLIHEISQLADYGTEKIGTLINSYNVHKIQIQIQGEVGFSQLDIRAEDTESEWKLFRRLIFVWYNDSILQEELSTLIDSDNSDIDIAFPNLPGEDVLQHTMCICSIARWCPGVRQWYIITNA